MNRDDSNAKSILTELLSADDAENAAIEFEPARLNLTSRAVEL